MPTPALSLAAFHTFLAGARISIRFQDPVPDSSWQEAICSRVMIIALRSPHDMLSATYTSFPAFALHLSNISINDEPMPLSDACVHPAPNTAPALPSLMLLQLQFRPH